MGRARIFLAASLFSMVGACGGDPSPAPEGQMAVKGTVSSRLSVNNARVVAVGADGRRFWTYLDADRDFTLKLPVGQSYRVIIANQRVGGGQTTIGHLVIDGAGGTSPWLGANEPATVDLGKIRPASSTPSAVRPQCAVCGTGGGAGGGEDRDADEREDDDRDNSKAGGSSNHDDDNDCHSGGNEDDDDKDKNGKSGSGNKDDVKGGSGGASRSDTDKAEKCDVCTESDKDVELEPSKEPGTVCQDQQTKKPKPKYDDQKPCTKKKPSGSGGSGGSSPPLVGGREDGGGSGGTGGGSGGTVNDGTSAAPPGHSCEQTAQCVNSCSCVAATCAPR